MVDSSLVPRLVEVRLQPPPHLSTSPNPSTSLYLPTSPPPHMDPSINDPSVH